MAGLTRFFNNVYVVITTKVRKIACRLAVLQSPSNPFSGKKMFIVIFDVVSADAEFAELPCFPVAILVANPSVLISLVLLRGCYPHYTLTTLEVT